MARANFPDAVCAACFEAARSVCEYCGLALWLPLYGMKPNAPTGWTDHLKPASQGGAATLENAVNACHACNYARGTGDMLTRLFQGPGKLVPNWRPNPAHERLLVTRDFSAKETWKFAKLGVRVFADVHASDWYLNRAMRCLFLGAWWDANDRRVSGKPFVRDAVYYAKATLKGVRAWRRHAKGVLSLEDRGLPLGEDTEEAPLFLGIRTVDSVDDVLASMKALQRFKSR